MIKLFQTNSIVILAAFVVLFSGISCNNKSENRNTDSTNGTAYVTTFDNKSLLKEEKLFNEEPYEHTQVITIDTTTTYQIMDGFGYTLTGGSAMLLHKMTTRARAAIIKEIFGNEEEQLNVSYLRISIGSSDLDEKTFSYDDMPNGEKDVDLEHFSLAYDTIYLIPTLQQIKKVAPNVKILGSPWSPPRWMKTNNSTKGGSLLPEYYSSYANYFVKYIRAMETNGITIDAITVQNEPLHPGNNPSLLMLPDEQKVFVRDYLGPRFQKENIATKIIIYDHNADRPDYPITILDDPEAAKYIDGSAFHLYGGEVNAISQVHEAHPEKNLYFTEQWVGAPGDFAQEMQWHTENLIIGATRNWCKTVLEWNLAADEYQDPHTDGGCTQCLGAITLKGDEIERNPAYYIIGQASRFVPQESVRVASNLIEGLPNVAFKTPENQVVLIVQNNADKEREFAIAIHGMKQFVTIPAASVVTYVF
ncbi:glycoside hydrolase family 30 protein [Neptunitalea lumnitzerae]|uniref:Glucosylceramidase n=1 Tax=Neptunitalea lumnitzerae TaxID=2965509 RepID=A0ABQ5MJ07_9FLAO|nr:glycoside hydrolase family 30 beta sandwich domain-containing protein [Neptunitalea sp. Y10]GLB49401.1 glucosylceramidase [Neptunitalea sp. Y10]